jgi:hypothetical protein
MSEFQLIDEKIKIPLVPPVQNLISENHPHPFLVNLGLAVLVFVYLLGQAVGTCGLMMFFSGICSVVGIICYCAVRYVQNEKLRTSTVVPTANIDPVLVVVDEPKIGINAKIIPNPMMPVKIDYLKCKCPKQRFSSLKISFLSKADRLEILFQNLTQYIL